MLQDKFLEFCSALALTVTAASPNQVDLGPTLPNVGWANGSQDEIPIIPTIDTTFTAGGAATLQFQVRSSAASNMSSPVVHYTSAAIPVASLVAGADLEALGVVLAIPQKSLRYVDVNMIVATGPMTAGAITICGAPKRQQNR